MTNDEVTVERYQIYVPDARLSDLRGKIANYDWSQVPDGNGWEHGVGKTDLKRLIDFWIERFD